MASTPAQHGEPHEGKVQGDDERDHDPRRDPKEAAVDVAAHQVDTSRCVVCFNCSSVCGKGALKWK